MFSLFSSHTKSFNMMCKKMFVTQHKGRSGIWKNIPLIFKKIFKHHSKCQKIWLKNLHIYVEILCTHKVVWQEPIFMVSCVKIRNQHKESFWRDIYVYNLRMTQKISYFHENFHSRIECQDVHAIFFLIIYILKCFFYWQEHMHSISNVNFQWTWFLII
jgi:hypothetical protein